MGAFTLFLLAEVAIARVPNADTPLAVHGAHARQFGHQEPVERSQPDPGRPVPPPPNVTVYGYHPYWGPDPTTLDFSRLTHLAIFNVDLAADGTLDDTHRWTEVAGDVVPLAHAEGVSVQLCVTSFDDSVMASVLPDPDLRAIAIDEIVDLVDGYDADGVNIDFEGLDVELKHDFTAFVQELSVRVDELTLALPAIDWNGAYDYDELAAASDGLFIMGYGYHWTGGNPGPVAPLYGGDPWSDYSLEWTVDDYLRWGATADKIILGLPLYGNEWPTLSDAVPGTASDDGWAVIMSSADAIAEDEGGLWDETTLTAYVLRTDTQLWYDNTDGVRYRIQWAVDQGLQGVGFWALGYENEEDGFWDMVTEETAWEEDDPEPSENLPPVAIASSSGLAYPGDLVELDGTASYDPEGAELSYSWTRLDGPPVAIENATEGTSMFTPEQSGVYTFALVVGDGTLESEAATVDVVVAANSSDDPKSEGNCGGCSTGTGKANPWWMGLLVLFAGRRRA